MFWEKHSFLSHHHKRALWAHCNHKRSWCHLCLCVIVYVWLHVMVQSDKSPVFFLGVASLNSHPCSPPTVAFWLLLLKGEIEWCPQAAVYGEKLNPLLNVSANSLSEEVQFQTNSNLLAWGWVRFVKRYSSKIEENWLSQQLYKEEVWTKSTNSTPTIRLY